MKARFLDAIMTDALDEQEDRMAECSSSTEAADEADIGASLVDASQDDASETDAVPDSTDAGEDMSAGAAQGSTASSSSVTAAATLAPANMLKRAAASAERDSAAKKQKINQTKAIAPAKATTATAASPKLVPSTTAAKAPPATRAYVTAVRSFKVASSILKSAPVSGWSIHRRSERRSKRRYESCLGVRETHDANQKHRLIWTRQGPAAIKSGDVET